METNSHFTDARKTPYYLSQPTETPLEEDMDEAQIKNRDSGFGCWKCNYRGGFKREITEERKNSKPYVYTAMTVCECKEARVAKMRLCNEDFSPQLLDFDFREVAQASGIEMPQFLKLPAFGARFINSWKKTCGGEVFEIEPGRPVKNLIVSGGDFETKRVWATNVMYKCALQVAMGKSQDITYRYYAFDKIRRMAASFHQIHLQEDFVYYMKESDLVVIDGVKSRGLQGNFFNVWDDALTSRLNANLPTIFLCEEDYRMESYAWERMLRDPNTLRINLSPPAASAAAQRQHSAPSTQSSFVPSLLACQDEVEGAIMQYLLDQPEKTWNKIIEAVPAEATIFKASMDSLKKSGDVLHKTKPGNKGVLTVYYVRQEEPSEDVSSPAQTFKRMSVTALAAATGKAKSTISEHIKRGKTDAEILALGNKNCQL